MSHRDSSPVYYREIQKNAYLKRIQDDGGISKLRPLGLKKPLVKPLWTQLCVHNGRTPYLEQYRDPTSARAHRPVWRASLLTARHVTASVTSRDNEYDFLVDTHEGPVRMLAPDWDSMQDWVSSLRNKLHELKILPLCENVYAAPPAAPVPRAAARDPTSPLPPTPPVPPDRVPGIDLTPINRATIQPTTTAQPATTIQPTTSHPPPPPPTTTIQPATTIQSAATTATTNSSELLATSSSITAPEHIDISSWEVGEAPFTSLPSTSQVPKSVAKICGQNICLDDSIFKRTCDSDDDDFISGDKSSNVSSEKCVSEVSNYKQTVVVGDCEQGDNPNETSDRPSNITVIQVSNKEPPHTAIPVIGPETDVFDFDFKSIPDTSRNPNFINIVNTEVNVQNSNEYGTVFTKNEPEYGHLSLTTTVSLSGDVKMTDVNVKNENDGLYERLCLASTSNNSKASPLSIRRLKSQEKMRKSSLPNLDAINSDSTYEYLFLSQNNNSSGNITSSSSHTPVSANITQVSTNITPASTNITHVSTNITPSSTNITQVSTIITPVSTNMTTTSANITTISTNTLANVTFNSEIYSNSRTHVNSEPIEDPIRGIRSNIERSNSQNTYDVLLRREGRIEQNHVPKRNGKIEKLEPTQPKPIWKRGLTELSLLTRLRGIGQGKRQESPSRNEHDRSLVTSPVKVVHRSRPEVRVDRNTRRSNSLSNGQSPPSTSVTPSLQPLRARQAAALRSEQRRGAALVAAVRCADPPIFADYNKQVWVAQWGAGGCRWSGRAGDRVCGVRGAAPATAHLARGLVDTATAHAVDILFHRVPLGKIYVICKRNQETTGIKLDSECNITSVEPDSPAALAGLPPPGKWAVTEVNNRPINLIKGGEDDMNRLSLHGTEASVLIQPTPLVKKLRAAIKGNKTLLGLR